MQDAMAGKSSTLRHIIRHFGGKENATVLPRSLSGRWPWSAGNHEAPVLSEILLGGKDQEAVEKSAEVAASLGWQRTMSLCICPC